MRSPARRRHEKGAALLDYTVLLALAASALLVAVSLLGLRIQQSFDASAAETAKVSAVIWPQARPVATPTARSAGAPAPGGGATGDSGAGGNDATQPDAGSDSN